MVLHEMMVSESGTLENDEVKLDCWGGILWLEGDSWVWRKSVPLASVLPVSP